MKKINQKNFKNTLSQFSTGVTVISIKSEKKIIGKTVNSFSSLSLSPPLVLFSLDKKSSSISNFKKTKYLSINFLNKNQKHISINFAKKNSKWNNTDFFYTQFHTPIIKGCLANLECIIEKLIPMGDHIIFICKVINILNNSNKVKPLIYYNTNYL
tara:strand:+ start:379 stop:846 length:468 start_codon:yes stop_codon:yes gene_type:complete